MDQKSRQIIKQNEKLINNLDIRKLEPYLRKSKLFTNSMLNDILNIDSKYSLYSELSTRGPDAYSKFLQILIEAGCENDALSLKQSSTLNSMSKYVDMKKDWDFYKMNTKPVGVCLIINNVNFKKLENKKKGDTDTVELKDREGSDVDADNLRRFFEKLDYTVFVRKNLEGMDMKKYLKYFSQNELLKQVSCCFVIILSHGGKLSNSEKDFIYGTDAVSLLKEDIYDIFKNENCEFLRHKPKIFIFQACRGTDEDWGFYTTNTADSTKFVKYPSWSDILVVHSSLPNHKAYRDHTLGSWLVQDLLSVFYDNYLVKPLMQMLNTVSRKIQGRLTQNDEYKQVVHKEDFGLRADIHICSNDDYKGCEMAVRHYI